MSLSGAPPSVTVGRTKPTVKGSAMFRPRLSKVPFFEHLKKKDLELIGRQTDEVDVPEGKVLAREGDFGQEFFVVESGTADVSRGGEVIARLGIRK